MQVFKKIIEKFHTLPDDVSGKQHRFFVFTNYAFLVAGLFHFAFIWIFALLDLPLLSIYNIISSVLWGGCIYLNLQGRRVIQLLLANAEVLIHATLCVAVLGWDSGFHYYILTVPLVVFLSPWEIQYKIGLCAFNCVAYALMYHIYRHWTVLRRRLQLYQYRQRFFLHLVFRVLLPAHCFGGRTKVGHRT